MRTLALAVLALTALAAMPAAAQFDTGRGGSTGPRNGGINPPPGTGEKPVVPPPSAVPGAKARPDSVTPTTRGSTDLAPTEALFDAINRGDIASARDAINRGADLDSTNLLGLTPIELSVDLARNDISFLLLSMRGASGSSQAARPPAAPAPVAAERRVRRPPAVAAVREASPAPGRAPVLFAGNGGAPVPSAGFLGFDPHR